MLNQFNGIGRLAKDPEMRQTGTGKSVVSFTVCCEYGWGDNKKTEFVRCIAWEKLADIIDQYLKKGSMCYISGNMATRSWDDKDGNKRYSTEIVVQDMKMLGGNDSKKSPGWENSGSTADTPF